ncbi:DUF397 domain-containing protein (plasmid) [Streptomyces sp. BI20]|uniref:DUF397 domain-containing protein n=1 Tax=Streptomyces sp. BI20 TaxID=3403460 RepID=UPI003C75570B
MSTEAIRWFKSSYSQNGGECVEVSADLMASATVPVRDSKNPAGPTLAFGATAFTAFVAGVKDAHR